MSIEITEEMITAEMARADARVCVGSDRCFAFPDRLEDARETCTPKGRCKVGGTRRVIVSQGGRESFDVWLEVSTGLVKLVPQKNAGEGDTRLVARVVAGDWERIATMASKARPETIRDEEEVRAEVDYRAVQHATLETSLQILRPLPEDASA
jgi:hypothetical protein